MRRGREVKRETVPGEVVDELMDEVMRRLTSRLADDLRRVARLVQQGKLQKLPRQKRAVSRGKTTKRRLLKVEPFRLVAH